MVKRILDYRGFKYEMGATFSTVKKGDIAMLKDGRLEIISKVRLSDDYENGRIKTVSGETYYSFLPDEIIELGKRVA